MKIDAATHIVPPKYRAAVSQRCDDKYRLIREHQGRFPALTDMESRFRVMEPFGDYRQVISHTFPFIEKIAGPKDTVELVKMGNDELAELVAKHPDRFAAAVGNLPMNDIGASLDEIDRIVKDLDFRGIQLCTSINGKPLDDPSFLPVYERMARYDLPILLHPDRPMTTPDYPGESISKFDIYGVFGWPYESTAAMTRLVFSGVFEKYPGIKFVTHHCGAMVPYFEQRIAKFYHVRREMGGYDYARGLTKPPREYFRMFYGDTALNGSTPALTCGVEFFGVGHVLFGSDMPYDPENGAASIRDTVKSIEGMKIPAADKEKIFTENARELFRLSV
ncbi:MAG: amidohydrolase family protein [Chloroflexota bacterium]